MEKIETLQAASGRVQAIAPPTSVHAAAAGLDVHKMQITATVCRRSDGGSPHVVTREFSALASGLALLVQWLLSLRVTGAVMEATGIYWEKSYDVLSHAGLDVMVVHAQHVKQIKHRKTDIADSVWLSRVCQFGLASPSLLLPRKTFRDLRGLSRYRRTLIEQRAQKQVRIQKVLDRDGIRIGGILSRITPASTVVASSKASLPVRRGRPSCRG